MINVLLNGCNGKMGQIISQNILKYENMHIIAGINPLGEKLNDYPVYKNIFDYKDDFDIIIDFSVAETLDNLLSYALKRKKPLLIATTGHSPQQVLKIKKYSEKIPIFHCSNTSLGVNVLVDIVKKTASILGENFDIEIIEKHHSQKIDAPSGTAVTIVNAINNISNNKYECTFDRHLQKNKRLKKEIGIHSIRGGTYVGEHSVIFAGNDEILEIKHIALSKNIFAEGTFKIIEFMINKPSGLYSMDDLLKA